MRKLLETKLYSRNLIKMINTWSVPLLWLTREDLKHGPENKKTNDQAKGFAFQR